MKKKLLQMAFALLATGSSLQAQTQMPRQTLETGDSVEFMNVKQDLQLTAEQFLGMLREGAKLSKESKLIETRKEVDALGWTHIKYQQQHENIPIEGAVYILHLKDGYVQKANGKIVGNLNLNITPTVTEKAAIEKAMSEVKCEKYAFQDSNQVYTWLHHKKRLLNDLHPIPTLTIVCRKSEYSSDPDDFALAWRVDVRSVNNLESRTVYLDAKDGSLIHSLPIANECIATYGPTIWHGVRPIKTSYSGGTYRLKENCYSHGDVQTFNYSSGWAADYSSTSNIWTIAQRVGVEAHHNARMALDHLWHNHSRDSYDGAGGSLAVYADDNITPHNAYYDGSGAIYLGRGSSPSTSFACIDIVGHEIAHAVIQTSAGLMYHGESGAINESIADILGEMTERSHIGSCDWLMGAQRGTPLRNMANPNTHGQPDTYGGLYYTATSGCSPSPANDYCGVHTNSGVLNYWYYLLVNGGSGTNDIGTSYSVTGIGYDAAMAIVYRMLAYLTPTSNYNNARIASINSAQDIYGSGSSQYAAIQNAWCAVGVGSCAAASPGPCSLTSITPSTISPGSFSAPGATVSTTPTYTWFPVAGATHFQFSISIPPYGITNVIYSVCISGTSFTLPPGVLLPGAQYRWDIRAQVGCSPTCMSIFSADRYFTTSTCTPPIVSSISGSSSVCTGASELLSNTTPSGVWSSSNPSVANVSSGGTVNGFSSGTCNVSYTVTNSCGSAFSTKNITVNPTPSASFTTGSTTICVGASLVATPAMSGGIWSSSNPSVATVSPFGIVTAILPGSTVITHSLSTACGSNSSNSTIVVNPLPSAGAITGPGSMCAGATIILSSSATSGSWSSASPSIATISSSGVVTGISSGTTVVSYSVSGSCGTVVATKVVTVNAMPDAGVISGAISVCVASPVAFFSSTTGGTWSVSTAIATISPTGVLTGVAAGTVTITYTVTSSCGTDITTKAITVNALPPVAPISGFSSVCVGSSIALTSSTSGGVWLSSSPTIASVNSTGIVSGIATGTATISYTLSTSCGNVSVTKVVSVNTLPGAGVITGPDDICQGSLSSYFYSSGSAVWSSSHPSIATVTGFGHVTAITAGTTTISCVTTNACGSTVVTKNININPLPVVDTIAGASSVCVGSSITLSNSIPAGSWSISSASFASISASGVVTGVAVGTATVSYTMTNSCGVVSSTKIIHVISTPPTLPISGIDNICHGNILLGGLLHPIAGGTWSTSPVGVAIVTSSGNVLGLTPGSTVVTYTVGNTCGTANSFRSLTVNPLPSSGTITGHNVVCQSSMITLSPSIPGGSWSSSNAHALVSSIGTVFGISAGIDTISYQVTEGSCFSVVAHIVTVNPLPVAGVISAASRICIGSSTTLANSISGGVWSSAIGHAFVSTSGVIYGLSVGIDTVLYSITNMCGTVKARHTIKIDTMPYAGSIIGPDEVCIGESIYLTNSATEGMWKCSDTLKAAVNEFGKVTGITSGGVTIQYKVTNSCASASANYMVEVLQESECATQIDVVNNPVDVIVYPNPATNNINIKLPRRAKVEVVLYSISGEKVISKIVDEGELKDNITLQVTNLARGTYVIRVTTEFANHIEKLILN